MNVNDSARIPIRRNALWLLRLTALPTCLAPWWHLFFYRQPSATERQRFVGAAHLISAGIGQGSQIPASIRNTWLGGIAGAFSLCP